MFVINSLETSRNFFLYTLLDQYVKKGLTQPQLYVHFVRDIRDNQIKMNVNQATNEKTFTKLDKRVPVFYVFKKQILNALGVDDWVYYYMTYLRKWSRYWCTDDTFNIAKYRKSEGILFSPEVFTYNAQLGSPLSVIAVITPDENNSPTVYYAKLSDICKTLTGKHDHHSYFKDERMGGIERSGAPKEIFSTVDPYQ